MSPVCSSPQVHSPRNDQAADARRDRYRSHTGVGADVSFDLDKAVKTALAEAIKKACHQYGIALELWEEERRGGFFVDDDHVLGQLGMGAVLGNRHRFAADLRLSATG